MTFDWMLKKSFFVLVLALLTLIAYFHATIAMQFVAVALLKKSFPARSPAADTKLTNAAPDAALGAAILARNPFDSVTGPLGPPAVRGNLPTDQRSSRDPLAVPDCDGVAAFITTESSDRAWSLASLRASGDPHPRLRRVGDAVGGKQVTFIGYNPRQHSPAVWLASGDELCQVLLFRTASEQPSTALPVTTRASSQVSAEIASGIHQVREGQFDIDRKLVDRLLEDQGLLMKGVRVVPERQDGRAIGIRLFGVRPGSPLAMLGLASGDRLDSINGYNVANPEKALEAYAHLRFAENLSLALNRDGKAVSVDYHIR